MPHRTRFPWQTLGAAALLACGLPAPAGPLGDPTRPPAALAPLAGAAASPRGPAPGRAGPSAATPAAAPAAPAPVPLPVLQSVQTPARGPAVAMVDGQLVKAGDSVAGRLVLSIDSQGLVLRGSSGDERLSLLDGTPKQAAGSILTSRSARYVPAPPAPEPAAEPETPSRTELAARGLRASAFPAAPATTGPLSLAGKTTP